MVSLIGAPPEKIREAFVVWAYDLKIFIEAYKFIWDANPSKSQSDIIAEAECAVFGEGTRSGEISKY